MGYVVDFRTPHTGSVTGSFSGSVTGSLQGTASFAVSASYALRSPRAFAFFV